MVITVGETYRPFYINKPPIAGECVTEPWNGTALVTKFKVYCPVPFEDPHKPFVYEISSAGEPAKQNDPTKIKQWNYFHKGERLRQCQSGKKSVRRTGNYGRGMVRETT